MKTHQPPHDTAFLPTRLIPKSPEFVPNKIIKHRGLRRTDFSDREVQAKHHFVPQKIENHHIHTDATATDEAKLDQLSNPFGKFRSSWEVWHRSRRSCLDKTPIAIVKMMIVPPAQQNLARTRNEQKPSNINFKLLDQSLLSRKHSPVNRFRELWGLVIVLSCYAFLIALLPIGTAFQFGDDEGFEVIKPFLIYKGHTLYTEIWNDQPPVLTMILVGAFKIFSPTILVARCVSVGFGAILLVSFHELLRARCGKWAALISSALLLTAPSVLLLSASVMLEAAAIGTALAATWMVYLWGQRRHWGFLVASGVLAGVALQIKMTAAVVLPALLVEVVLLTKAKPIEAWIKAITLPGCIWGTCLLASLVLIGTTWGKGSLKSSWKSHTGTQEVSGLQRPEDQKFQPRLLKDHLETVVLAAIAGAVALWRKRLRELAFPFAMLATVSVIHTIHRPWWNYYYLHFAIPLAWLAGWVLNEIAQLAFRTEPRKRSKGSPMFSVRTLALCAVVALPLARAERRLESILKDMRQRPTIASNSIVARMREYAERAKWCYSENGIYAFHAQIPVPPEIAIIMPKRFWSGQISTTQIIEACRKQRIELVVLPTKVDQLEWSHFLSAGFVTSAADDKGILHVGSGLIPERN